MTRDPGTWFLSLYICYSILYQKNERNIENIVLISFKKINIKNIVYVARLDVQI